MSSVARKRRAEAPQSQPQQAPQYNPNIQAQPQSQPQTQNKPMGTGLTLPQVISVIDTRLITLENFMKETKQDSDKKVSFATTAAPAVEPQPNPEFVDEVQTRFDILAREIADLKDVVLKLQSYTMDVNKTLLEERIQILSDLDREDSNEGPQMESTNE
jgi:hypothetical protein